MERLDKPDPRQQQLLPVVRYAVTRKAEKNPDYWDYATLLELAVLADERDDAQERLSDATGSASEAWMLESSARNLALIRKQREARQQDAAWIGDLERQLLAKAARLAPPAKA